ncbi:MAG: hypothetical protein HS111_00815 [Kofleriaceae bacterium]|nr:hypothetical protein [Kofleriaceae bacterium]MCL4226114.1 hypothetical protein [Myxococcales bacterium]
MKRNQGLGHGELVGNFVGVGADKKRMNVSTTQSPAVQGPRRPDDLGSPVAKFLPKVLSAGNAAVLLLLGAAGVGLGARESSWLLMALSMAIFALPIAAIVTMRRNGMEIELREGGLVIRQRGRLRLIAWDMIENVHADYSERSGRYGSGPHDTIVVSVGGQKSVLLSSVTVTGARTLGRLVEHAAAPVLAARAAAALDGGTVIPIGQLHLDKNGWIILNERVPWRDLESIQCEGGQLRAWFSSVGLHEIGPYHEMPAACGLLHLAVERARAGGANVADLDFVPVRQA